MFPGLTRYELTGVLCGLLSAPFWFVHVPGVNLGPVGLIAMAVLVSYGIRTSTIPIAPSLLSGVGIILFLCGAALSLVMAPAPFEGLQNYLQYILLFAVVVPMGLIGFRSRRNRWVGFVGLVFVLNGLAVATFVTALWSGRAFRNITFWYGNQNQLYWLISSVFLLNLGVVFEDTDCAAWLRSFAMLGLVLTSYLVIRGLTLSALLIMVTGSWLFVLWLLRERTNGRRTIPAFLGLTVLIGAVGVAYIANNWQWFYIQGSLHVRIPQYKIALREGITAFPFGTGLESSEFVYREYPDKIRSSVHNFVLAYFLETGMLGVVGFGLVLVAWFKDVLVATYLFPGAVSAFEFSFVALFGSLITIMLFQPVPVRRFWWLIFAISWAAVIEFGDGDMTVSDPEDTRTADD